MSNFYLITPERLVHTYAQMYCMQRRMQHIYHTPIWSMRQKQFSPREEGSERCSAKQKGCFPLGVNWLVSVSVFVYIMLCTVFIILFAEFVY